MKLGGFSEQFTSPGGGFVNLDFYKRALDYCKESIVLLGEGTFHQIHGGVTTNSINQEMFDQFAEEYGRIRKTAHFPPTKKPILVGCAHSESKHVLYNSAKSFCIEHFEPI
jgi:hypothetical protein